MGRPPAPTALKLVRGERGDRINNDEPVPAALEVECPDWVNADGKALWAKLAPDLVDKAVLTHWDADLFASACDWWGIYRRAARDVWRRGSLVSGHRNQKVKNPNVQMAREAFDAAARIFARFGMTPADRAQLRVTPQGRSSGVERYLD